MSGDLESLAQQYTVALEAYLREPGEEALRSAGELGRQASKEGCGILDTLTLHEQALEQFQPAATPGNLSGADSTSSKARRFLREVLAPLDLKFRSSLQLEAELERTKHTLLEQRSQIEAVNKELESFRYSVSHDLRAPLRAIEGFGAILEEEHGPALDEEGRHCLEIVRSSTRRLGQLIDDLLLLVRVGRSEFSRQHVHISEMAREVAAELQRQEPERKVAFHAQEGLSADADPKLLRLVLEHLLGNAWKFTGKTAEPDIEFGAVERPEGVAFFVRDNGVGFNMEYAGRLFTPFQRLHSEAEFPGTGIGLAVVRRIVERHGGRAWAQAEVDHGATVFFTFPPAPSTSAELI